MIGGEEEPAGCGLSWEGVHPDLLACRHLLACTSRLKMLSM